MNDDKRSIERTPQIRSNTGLQLFKPIEIVPQIKHSLASSRGSATYTYAEIRKIWNMISDNSEMKGMLQEACRSFFNVRKTLFSDSYSTLGSAQNI